MKQPKLQGYCRVHKMMTDRYEQKSDGYLRCKLCAYDKVVRYRKKSRKKSASNDVLITSKPANDEALVSKPTKRFYKPCYVWGGHDTELSDSRIYSYAPPRSSY